MLKLINPNIIFPVTLVERDLEREGDIYPGSLGFIFSTRMLNTKMIEYKLLFIRFGKAGRKRLTRRTIRCDITNVTPFHAVDTIHKNSLLMDHNTFSGYVISYCLFIKNLHRNFPFNHNMMELMNKFVNKGSEYESIVWTNKGKLNAIKVIKRTEAKNQHAIKAVINTLNATFDDQ